MEEILFTKMHGIGNDYIYISCLESTPPDIPALSIEMSRPHTGVGADGIITIGPSDVADFRMRIFNADGSEARMCGNGARCVGKYLWDHHLTRATGITLETLSGIRRLTLHPDCDGHVNMVSVDMGEPCLDCDRIPVTHTSHRMIEHHVATSMGELPVTAVSMGNPHGVIFTELPLASLPLHSIGPELENHPMWPDRANIEFARIINSSEIEMRVWERGSGETQACGTGACAVAAAAMLTGRAATKVTIRLFGGDLEISRREPDGHLIMTGPAATVFEGRYFISSSNPARQ